ncbi:MULTISPECIES: TIGR03767 family metallophosphoesterase [unclassified Streptomyces]|uniref:TIGR03767 family metallophosphoesterase n=1 Tax=unclassified Streptomyces TaxID=2593676 RepID=UPI00278C1FE5|nr:MULTISPECIES: TIGR03767 family metallophosphoesterase [unclassified Streptomyces]
MPRIRSVTTTAAAKAAAKATAKATTEIDRRALLTATTAVTLSAGIGYALGPAGETRAAAHPATAPVHANSRKAPAAPLAPYTRGTTLASIAAATATGPGYRRLGDGPAWTRAVRTELAPAHPRREAKRTALAAFVQFTDLHLVDVQHPLRYEYLRSQTASAWRPQEALSVAGAVALVERVNALRGAPVTASPLHFVMTTGDNTDNNARSELDWFLKAMSGGRIRPNTGDPRHYEGVQNSDIPLYWHPDAALRDTDKREHHFPRIPGFLDAAISELRSPGLNLPWYSTVGNHDSLPGGCYAPADPYFAEFAVGGRKLMDLDTATGKAIWDNVQGGGDPKGKAFKELLRSHTRKMRHVTPDASRAPFTPAEYIAAHLDPGHTGPGPIGHGYTQANLATATQYYAFRVSDDVLGISLDTTDPAGHYEGSIGTTQLDWLTDQLKKADHRGDHVIVFSHHTSKTMRNLREDPTRPGEHRHGGEELTALLAAHRPVLAWVNGHSHKNDITPHPGEDGAGTGFWEISTASHVDFPQLARVIEIADNHDGTLSVFTTLIESSAPHRTDFADLTQTGLAALYRELSFNAPGSRATLSGAPGDRNTELVLQKG